MDWLTIVSRVLHISGAIMLLGGLFYLRVVVTPAAAADGTSPDTSFGGRRATWAMAVGVATLFLLASGTFNYWYISTSYEKLPGSYHALIGVKILLAMAVFFLAALLAGRSPAAQKSRMRMRFWLDVCLALGIAIVILAAVLRTYEKRKPPADDPTQIAAVRSVE